MIVKRYMHRMFLIIGAAVLLAGCAKAGDQASGKKDEVQETTGDEASGSEEAATSAEDDKNDNADDGLFNSDGIEADLAGSDGEASSDKADQDKASDNDNAKGEQAWRKDMIEYLEGKVDDEDYGSNVSLLNVDDDGIPELFLDGGSTAAGVLSVIWKDGKLTEEYFAAGGYTYIPRQNLLMYSSGHSDIYSDSLLELDDKGWKTIAQGEYGAEDNSNVQYDKEGNPVYKYYWNDKEVSKSEYEKEFDGALDFDKGEREPEIFGSAEAVAKCLETYDPDAKEDGAEHRYEIVVSDVSWSEAKDACEEEGGHLVRLEDDEEFDKVCALIKEQGMEDKIFWTDGSRDEFIYMYGWLNDDGTYTTKGLTTYRNDRWLLGEPSFSGDTASGDYVEEDSVNLFYHKASNAFVYNDAPSDILSAVPDYKGRIAYIIEFDE